MLWFCDQVIVLGNKGIIADGPPAESLDTNVLNRIYGNECRVMKVDNLRMVVPSIIHDKF